VSFPFFFFFNDTATTEIYTLSLHDALPIFRAPCRCRNVDIVCLGRHLCGLDRKSTRLNSSHVEISYAVFCLKKKTTGFAGTAAFQYPAHDAGGNSDQTATVTLNVTAPVFFLNSGAPRGFDLFPSPPLHP